VPTVLIAAERLLTRLRHPASRAAELNALRERVRAEVERLKAVEPAERALAEQILARKRSLSAELTEVRSCASCATGLPAPHGSYAGGACCGGVTAELFDEHELAGLVVAGTRARDLVPPAGRDAHAGCTFRGPTGCTLDVAHRPGRCVLYLCDGLRRELHREGQLDGIEAELAALQRDMIEYIAVHKARVDREVLAPLVAALEDYAEVTK
jgi:hypothetical protein